MQAMLVKLEQAFLIERVPDKDQGRIQRTHLTQQGRKTLKLAHARVAKSERIAREAASGEAVAMLRRVADALS